MGSTGLLEISHLFGLKGRWGQLHQGFGLSPGSFPSVGIIHSVNYWSQDTDSEQECPNCFPILVV